MSRSRTLLAALALAAVSVSVLAGCTTSAAPHSVAATPTPTQAFALRISDAEVLEALGPVPAEAAPTPERLEHYRTLSADRAWAGYASGHPGVARPDVAVIEFVDPARQHAVVQDCVAAQGAALPADGSADAALLRANDLASYECGVQYPIVLDRMITEAQTAYLYDYWTGFVIPCYEETGHPSAGDPPTRAFFVENWPFQNWSPSTFGGGGQALSNLELEQLDLMCPAIPEDLGG